jgi:hypothetical protein
MVHERVIVDGRTARLTEPIEHDAIVDLEEAEAKSLRYAAAAAAEMTRAGTGSSALRAPFHGAAAFLRTFVVQAGFLDGVTGWRVAAYNARYTYRKWQALRALTRQG